MRNVDPTIIVALALFAVSADATAKPLTPRQYRNYKILRSIPLTKQDARRVARDPGVKKGKWGWACEGGGSLPERVRNDGTFGKLAKYRKNAVCE